jgi:hypothetical protein
VNRQAKTLQAKAKKMQIGKRPNLDTWDVKSTSGKSYIVWRKRDDLSCNCPFGQYNWRKGRVCSHILAVQRQVENVYHAQLASFWATEEDAARQHRRTERVGDVLMTVRAAA